jgi:hypothetical protein
VLRAWIITEQAQNQRQLSTTCGARVDRTDQNRECAQCAKPKEVRVRVRVLRAQWRDARRGALAARTNERIEPRTERTELNVIKRENDGRNRNTPVGT